MEPVQSDRLLKTESQFLSLFKDFQHSKNVSKVHASQLEEAYERIHQLREENAMLKMELSQSELKFEDASTAMAAESSSQLHWNKEKESLYLQIKELTATMKTYRSQLAEREKKDHNNASIIAEQAMQIKLHESQQNKLQSETHRVQETVKDLKSKMITAQEKLEAVYQQHQESKKFISYARLNCQHQECLLRMQEERHHQETEALQEQLKVVHKQLSETLDQRENTRIQLCNVQEANKNLEVSLDLLKRDNEYYQNEKKTLDAQFMENMSQLATEHELVKTLTGQNNQTLQELAIQAARFEETTRCIGENKLALTKATEDATEAIRRLQETGNRLIVLETELANKIQECEEQIQLKNEFQRQCEQLQQENHQLIALVNVPKSECGVQAEVMTMETCMNTDDPQQDSVTTQTWPSFTSSIVRNIREPSEKSTVEAENMIVMPSQPAEAQNRQHEGKVNTLEMAISSSSQEFDNEIVDELAFVVKRPKLNPTESEVHIEEEEEMEFPSSSC